MTKYGLICGDFHCGHIVGLTPPAFQLKYDAANVANLIKYYDIAIDLWDCFATYLKTLPPLDFVVINGDMIEGKGKKSGGVELLTAKMATQCAIAVDVIEHIRRQCKRSAKLIATFGTPYHTTTHGDEWERIVAQNAHLNKIGAHEWLDVNGLIFDIKHKVGSSSIPHGRHTAISKELLWNVLWAEAELQPKADVLIRSHVHYYGINGTSDKLCMTLPALQSMGTMYGAKECSGLVDWGAVLFEVKDKDNYNWYPFIRKVESQKPKVVKV